jgi:hypothetical protein
VRDVCALLLAAFVLGGLYRLGHPEGFLSHNPAIAAVQDSHLGAFLPKVNARVPRDGQILIYCQSNGCPYSEKVARKLMSVGYRNITYFRDGWHGWEEYTAGLNNSSE